MRKLALLALLAAGCTADASESSIEGSTSAGSTGSQTSSTASSMPVDLTEPPASTSPATSASTSTTRSSSDSSTEGISPEDTSSTGSDPFDDRLFPLEIGRVWTYEVTPSGAVPTCAGGTFSEEVLGVVEVGGEPAFEMTSFCTAVDRTVFRVDGDVVDLDNGGRWIRVLDEPVEEGHGWNSTGPIDYTWRSEGSVTVPAGTFESCWTRVQVVSYTAETTFCRGVGMVRSLSSDLSGAGWDAELTVLSP